jgi:cytochrome P450
MQQNVGPNGFSLNVGHTWRMVNQPQKFTAWLKEHYGEIVSLKVRSESLVIVLTSEGARQVFMAEPDGYDAFWKVGFTGIAGPGSIWVLGGSKHRRERQLLSPAFHARNFRGYGEVIREVTRKHIQDWQPGQTFRVIETTLAISLDVIMRLVFGVEDETFIAEGRKVLKAIYTNVHPIIVFFPNLQRNWFPLWIRYAQAKADFSNWLSRCLVERRSRKVETNDILGRMLSSFYEDGTPMRDEDIIDELITILLAGHETTATALAWALYDLGGNPNTLEKLRAELDPLGLNPDSEEIHKLPYLNAVCNETLRLHTLLPEVARELVSPINLFGYTIQPGNFVLVSCMAIHHNPDLYPEPNRYQPERFINRSYTPFEFLPFGGGHRRCLGSHLSDYEMRIVLAEIVTHWDFTPTAVEREVRHDISMGPKNGVRLQILGKRALPEIIGVDPGVSQ